MSYIGLCFKCDRTFTQKDFLGVLDGDCPYCDGVRQTNSTEFPTFWMVLGTANQVTRHETKEAAEAKAEELSRISPSRSFYILQAISSVQAVKTQWKNAVPNEVPKPLEDSENVPQNQPIGFRGPTSPNN